MNAQEAYLQRLLEHGLLIDTGVEGLYGRSGTFEDIVERINVVVSRWGGGDGAEVMRFPPAISKVYLEESEYLKSFPQLAGTVHSFMGSERDHQTLLRQLETGEDWTGGQRPTRIALTPAACYPVYPTVAKRGALPGDGRLIDVYSYCFRHEPSLDPARMQLFRMREYIRIGTPEQVTGFRGQWLERGQQLVASLGLPVKIDLANDPFFGRGGRVMASSQREQNLKFELLIPITSEEKPTACLSFNYHQDHFGQLWSIRGPDAALAHTACVGFGMERLTLALLMHHGFEVGRWPASVRAVLWG